MSNKSDLTSQKPTLLKEQNQELPQSNDLFLLIDQKMQRLRQKRQRLQVNQSLILTKEIQKMMGADYSPELALAVFDKTWTQASNSQKKEWHTHMPTFRHFFKPHYKKSQANDTASQKTGSTEVHPYEHS